jgi:hypothetical protein
MLIRSSGETRQMQANKMGWICRLRRARTFVPCRRLCVLQRAAGFEVGRDAGRTKRMTTDPDLDAKPRRPALDHPPCVDAVHGLLGQCAGAAGGGAEQVRLGPVADPGRLYM